MGHDRKTAHVRELVRACAHVHARVGRHTHTHDNKSTKERERESEGVRAGVSEGGRE